MQARAALVASIICAATAVGVVAADVAWGLETQIDMRTPSGWETVASEPRRDDIHHERFPHDCAGTDLRVLVDNDKPFGDTFDIRITYWDPASQRTEVVLDDTWTLGSFESRTHELTIPDEAFAEQNETDPRDLAPQPVTLDVRVDRTFLGTCVQKEATR